MIFFPVVFTNNQDNQARQWSDSEVLQNFFVKANIFCSVELEEINDNTIYLIK